MNDADRNPTSTPAPRRNGSRYLFMVILGLVLGAVGAVMVMRAIQQREDPYPHSVMHVMGAHIAALKKNIAANHCAATDTLPHLQVLRIVGNDIEPAFKDMANDSKFATLASDFRASTDAALSSPPLDCPGVQATLAKVGQKCEDCHHYANE